MTTETAQIASLLDSILPTHMITDAEGILLYTIAKACTGKGVIVEIGSWTGRSTIWLGKGSKAGNKVKVYAIDPHTGGATYPEFKNNIKMAGLDDIVVPIVKTSEEAEKGWNIPVELLWIDGSHKYDAVKLDFDKWTPHLVNDGTIAVHDTIFRCDPGPKRVVRNNVYRSRNFVVTGMVTSITYAQKVRSNTRKDRLKNRRLLLTRDVYEFLITPAFRVASKYQEHLPLKIIEMGRRILHFE